MYTKSMLVFVFSTIMSNTGMVCQQATCKTEKTDIITMQNYDYNNFDRITDSIVEKGMLEEKPQEITYCVAVIRKVGGALLLKYLALKKMFSKLLYRICLKTT